MGETRKAGRIRVEVATDDESIVGRMTEDRLQELGDVSK